MCKLEKQSSVLRYLNVMNGAVRSKMSATSNVIRLERLKELEAALAIRDQEIVVLNERKAGLLRARAASAGPSAMQHPTTAGGHLDPLRHPILRLVKHTGADFMRVSPEHVGDLCRQMNGATSALNQHCKVLDATIDELKLQLRHHEREEGALSEQIEFMREITGLPSKSGVTPRECFGRTAPSARYTDPTVLVDDTTQEEIEKLNVQEPDQSPRRTTNTRKHEVDNLRLRLHTISKEIRSAQVVKTRNEKTIRELNAEVVRRKGLVEEARVTHNQIRVTDRAVREKKITLKEFISKHEELDWQLAKKAESNRPRCSAILDRDVTKLKQQIGDCVENERRVQDRVLKAQDHRIEQLTRRMKLVDVALKEQRFDKQVAEIIGEALVFERETSQPLFPNSAAAGTDAAKTSDSPPSKDGGQLQKYGSSVGGQLVQAIPQGQEELYDIDTIIPPAETVHPAIYSLFVLQKERKAKSVSVQEILLKEKDEAVDALTGKVADLIADYDEAVGHLESTAAAGSEQLSQDEHEMVEQLTAVRVRVNELMKQKVQQHQRIRTKTERDRKRREESDAVVDSNTTARQNGAPPPVVSHQQQDAQHAAAPPPAEEDEPAHQDGAATAASPPPDEGEESLAKLQNSLVIFVDVEGVLLPASPMMFGSGDLSNGCIEQLKEIASHHTSKSSDNGIVLVLTSAWRNDLSKVKQLNEALARAGLPDVHDGVPDGVQNPTTDVPYLKESPDEQKFVCGRCDEINQWLADNAEEFTAAKTGLWLAIDDAKLDEDERLVGRFLLTSAEDGLTTGDAEKCSSIIAALVASADNNSEEEAAQSPTSPPPPSDKTGTPTAPDSQASPSAASPADEPALDDEAKNEEQDVVGDSPPTTTAPSGGDVSQEDDGPSAATPPPQDDEPAGGSASDEKPSDSAADTAPAGVEHDDAAAPADEEPPSTAE